MKKANSSRRTITEAFSFHHSVTPPENASLFEFYFKAIDIFGNIGFWDATGTFNPIDNPEKFDNGKLIASKISPYNIEIQPPPGEEGADSGSTLPIHLLIIPITIIGIAGVAIRIKKRREEKRRNI
jgi:hypothetical protein